MQEIFLFNFIEQDDEKMDFGDPFTEIPGKKQDFC